MNPSYLIHPAKVDSISYGTFIFTRGARVVDRKITRTRFDTRHHRTGVVLELWEDNRAAIAWYLHDDDYAVKSQTTLSLARLEVIKGTGFKSVE